MILINGSEQLTLSHADRGLSYGDGFFTTAKVVDGQVEFWRDHLERLMLSAKRFKIELPSVLTLFSEVQQMIQGVESGCLKITITRGAGGRGYSPQGCTQTTRILQLSPWPSHYQQWQQHGVHLDTATFTLGMQPALAGYKTLNRLEQVLIKQELAELDCDDVAVTDLQGNLVEASAGNLFWRQGDTLYTPCLSHSGVKGVMRKQVLNCAQRLDLPCQLGMFPVSALDSADEIFITNALMGIVPIKQFQQKQLSDFSLAEKIRKELTDD
ncbi:aminodeoxychorismate lyase [Motilimonas eburnea]|uniref:aminodeoxychorismate lyase n=1 Tax=Motilimonas eburnea TaxID=1737488 RepID=UPI001E2D07A3|nr:aminodeoxychorismate lyase [Motilimonas eburnea]MCE2570333.1 aminodeoxychorismate lyase [Motilimonas eburnea]